MEVGMARRISDPFWPVQNPKGRCVFIAIVSDEKCPTAFGMRVNTRLGLRKLARSSWEKRA